MPDPVVPSPLPPVDETAPPALFRRPVVVAGLAIWFVALGGLAVYLSESSAPAMAPRAFPVKYDITNAWVRASFPHIADPGTARLRFLLRVNELSGLAELYEMQKCWRKAAQAYEEIALLIPAADHTVNRYVRERVKVLEELER